MLLIYILLVIGFIVVNALIFPKTKGVLRPLVIPTKNKIHSVNLKSSL
ncbi:hypothetical protein B0O79_0648 [Flavobacteriaceae bacterium MAR_2009_75]|nr:hypothetical protein B0O79_0648 [Flavobacteriaceae bacterium MAR_2009_75]